VGPSRRPTIQPEDFILSKRKIKSQIHICIQFTEHSISHIWSLFHLILVLPYKYRRKFPEILNCGGKNGGKTRKKRNKKKKVIFSNKKLLPTSRIEGLLLMKTHTVTLITSLQTKDDNQVYMSDPLKGPTVIMMTIR
jgi:hypothetical protein